MLSLKGIIFVGLLAAMPPQEQDYQEAANALYNLDFSIAERGFETLTRESPDNPDYWNALASTIYLRVIHDQEKMNMESFTQQDKFGTRASREGVDLKDEKRLRDLLTTAMEKSKAILKNKPNDVRALYALGNSNATLAAFEATVKRSKFSALGPAKESRRLHEQVLKLDPSFHDARIAVGTYDYVVSVIPALLRWILRIGGSDKATGIRELEMGVAKGKLARTDGRMLLAVVYSREKRYNDALQVLNDLHGKYPRNFVFELSKGSVYEKMRQWDKAIQVYDQVLSKNTAKTDGYERLREEKIHYFIGNANVHRRQFDRAVESFHKVIAGANATPDEKAGSHLWIGKMLDSKKDRARAVQHYDAVLASKCDPELQAEARKYKRRAYGGV